MLWLLLLPCYSLTEVACCEIPDYFMHIYLQADVTEKDNDVKKIHEEKAKHTKDKAEKGKS